MENSKLVLTYYKPKKALIIYENEKSQNFCAVHDLIENGKTYTIGDAQQLSKEFIRGLFLDYERSGEKMNFIIPEPLLYQNSSRIIWYSPKEKIRIQVEGIKPFEMSLGEYRMIFMMRDNTLHIFLAKTLKRPDSKTKLFRMPTLNTSETGSVCMGNTKLSKERDIEAFILEIEYAFYNSIFTKEGNEDKYKYWKRVARKKQLIYDAFLFEFEKPKRLQDLIL